MLIIIEYRCQNQNLQLPILNPNWVLGKYEYENNWPVPVKSASFDTSSPLRTKSFHKDERPPLSKRLRKSTVDHFESVEMSGQRQSSACNVIFQGIFNFFSSHFLSRLKISFSVCQQRWRHNTRTNNILKNKNYSFQPDCREIRKFVSGNSVVPSWYDMDEVWWVVSKFLRR